MRAHRGLCLAVLVCVLLTGAALRALAKDALTPAAVAERVVKEVEPFVTPELKGIMNRMAADETAKLKNFATLSMIQGFPAGAAWAYAKLLKAKPSDAVYANNLAWLLVGAKKYDEANALLKMVQSSRPAWGTGHSTYAKYYAARGDWSRALAEVRRARIAEADNEELLWQEFHVLANLPGAQNEARALARKIRQVEEARLDELHGRARAIILELRKKLAERLDTEWSLYRRVLSCKGRGLARGEEYRKAIDSRVRNVENWLSTAKMLGEGKLKSLDVMLGKLDEHLAKVKSTRNVAWIFTRDQYLDGMVSVLNSACLEFIGNSDFTGLLYYNGIEYAFPFSIVSFEHAWPECPDYWIDTGSGGFWFDLWDPVYRDYSRKYSAAAPDRLAQKMIRNNYLRQLPGIWSAWSKKHRAWCDAFEPKLEANIARMLDDSWFYVAAVRNAYVVTRGLKWRNDASSKILMSFTLDNLEKYTALGTGKQKVRSWCDAFLAATLDQYGQRKTWNPTDACQGNNDYLPGKNEGVTLEYEGGLLQQYLAALRATWLAETLDLANVSVSFKLGENKGISIAGDGTVEMAMDTISVYKVAKLRVMGSWNFRTDEFSIGTGVFVTGESIVQALSGGQTRMAKLVNRMSPLVEAGLSFEVGGYVKMKGTLVQGAPAGTDVFAGASFKYGHLKPFSEKVEGSYDAVSVESETSLSEALAGSYLVARELAERW